MRCVSLDEEIVREAGRSIPEIVKEHGWPWFRDLETAITRRFSAEDGLVIDTGGGVILRSENVENLRRNGKLFWLRASVPSIVERIAGGTERPALTSGKTFTEEVEEVLRERTPLYKTAADFTVDTDDVSPEEVTAQIERSFLEGGNSNRSA